MGSSIPVTRNKANDKKEPRPKGKKSESGDLLS